MKVKTDQGEIHVECDGCTENIPVLLFNGARCTTRMWEHVIPTLQRVCRVIRFDVRGTGKSTTADNNQLFTFAQYAVDINHVLDTFDISSTMIWSMAWGSRLAMAYTAMHPARVTAAAYYDASIDAPDVKAQMAGLQVALERQRQSGLKTYELPEGWNTHSQPSLLPKSLDAMRTFDLRSNLHRLTVPILLATGSHDPNLSSTREIASLVPTSSLEVMADVGHGSVRQRPEKTTELFINFLNDLNSGEVS